jgi:hypothetical protein
MYRFEIKNNFYNTRLLKFFSCAEQMIFDFLISLKCHLKLHPSNIIVFLENCKIFFFLQKNLFRAFPYALKACELGSVDSCINVSVMYKKGEGVKQVSWVVLMNINSFSLKLK